MFHPPTPRSPSFCFDAVLLSFLLLVCDALPSVLPEKLPRCGVDGPRPMETEGSAFVVNHADKQLDRKVGEERDAETGKGTGVKLA